MYNFLVVVHFFVTCATCKGFLFLVSIIAGIFSSLKLLLAINYDKCSHSVCFFFNLRVLGFLTLVINYLVVIFPIYTYYLLFAGYFSFSQLISWNFLSFFYFQLLLAVNLHNSFLLVF
jgi:hypothetical protein